MQSGALYVQMDAKGRDEFRGFRAVLTRSEAKALINKITTTWQNSLMLFFVKFMFVLRFECVVSALTFR